jgi:hypothetical protein
VPHLLRNATCDMLPTLLACMYGVLQGFAQCVRCASPLFIISHPALPRRSAGKEIKVGLDEPRNMSLDDALEYINDDEMVEVSCVR